MSEMLPLQLFRGFHPKRQKPPLSPKRAEELNLLQ
jgi:hypothetical protein